MRCWTELITAATVDVPLLVKQYNNDVVGYSQRTLVKDAFGKVACYMQSDI
jgi:hypothetical protein